MTQYLYAIVERMPTAWRAPTRGLADASVVPRRIHDVVVLGSLVDRVPPATPRTLGLHHEIVATVMEATALLPLRYGTAVPASGLADWVAAHGPLVSAALGAVRDCLEMRVKLLRLEGAVDGRRARRASGAGEADDVALRRLADRLVETAGLPRWHYHPAGTGDNVAASVAFLVPRAEMPAFLARIAPVASHAVGVAVVPTGPWPPYSFVPDLERAPLGRVSTERPATTDRRAG